MQIGTTQAHRYIVTLTQTINSNVTTCLFVCLGLNFVMVEPYGILFYYSSSKIEYKCNVSTVIFQKFQLTRFKKFKFNIRPSKKGNLKVIFEILS